MGLGFLWRHTRRHDDQDIVQRDINRDRETNCTTITPGVAQKYGTVNLTTCLTFQNQNKTIASLGKLIESLFRMLTDDERLQSYLEFKKRKVEMQREYRAKLKSAQIEQGGRQKRKYRRKEPTSVQTVRTMPVKLPSTRPGKSKERHHSSQPSMLEENHQFLRDLNEEDFNSNDSPSVPVAYPEHSVEKVCLEEEPSEGEPDMALMMSRLDERAEHCDDYIVVEDQCFESTAPADDVEEEIDANIIQSEDLEEIAEEEMQGLTMNEEEEQEAFYNQRDRILRLMDRLPKVDRLHYLAEVEAMIHANINNK